MDITKLIRDYINQAKLMQVSTAKDAQPWTCTVYFAFDENLNLYWISLPTTRHSQEIRENEKVSGTIVLPHQPGDDVRGIQFQGVAKELLSGEEFLKGIETYASRMNMSEKRKKHIIDGKDGHVVYKITPSSFVLFDTFNFPNNQRQEVTL